MNQLITFDSAEMLVAHKVDVSALPLKEQIEKIFELAELTLKEEGLTMNDIILIILWIIAAAQDLMHLPMVFCFLMFLLNDIYAFINWRRMEKRQQKKTE